MKQNKLKANIQFHFPESEFRLSKKRVIRAWIYSVIKQHRYKIDEINFIFVGDESLLKMNQQILAHDYYTDIMTFPYHSKKSKRLQSDIFISYDRVNDNAQQNNSSFIEELQRVIIHGVLHLLGYDDHNNADITKMRNAETKALKKRPKKLKRLLPF